MIYSDDGYRYFYKDGGTYCSDIILDPYHPDGPFIDANNEYCFNLSIDELREIRDLIDEYLKGVGHD